VVLQGVVRKDNSLNKDDALLVLVEGNPLVHEDSVGSRRRISEQLFLIEIRCHTGTACPSNRKSGQFSVRTWVGPTPHQ